MVHHLSFYHYIYIYKVITITKFPLNSQPLSVKRRLNEVEWTAWSELTHRTTEPFGPGAVGVSWFLLIRWIIVWWDNYNYMYTAILKYFMIIWWFWMIDKFWALHGDKPFGIMTTGSWVKMDATLVER